MHNATQPVLCCLGRSVAGNPTQFVLERMLAAAQLDWRVFTVEVEESSVEDALRGLAAMNIDALKVIQDYDGWLASDFLINAASNQVVCDSTTADTVKLESGEWLVWNSQSEGWFWWHDRFQPFVTRQSSDEITRSTRLLLVGDSLLTRGVFDSITRAGPSNEETDRRDYGDIIWVGGPTSLQCDEVEKSAKAAGLGLRLATFESLNSLSEYLQPSAVAELSESQRVVTDCVVGPGFEEWSEFASLLERASVAIGTLCAVDDAGSSLAASEIQAEARISSSELTAAALAFDFKRWTGEEPDFDLMLEAIEEFNEF